jgi:hypothetical protein
MCKQQNSPNKVSPTSKNNRSYKVMNENLKADSWVYKNLSAVEEMAVHT